MRSCGTGLLWPMRCGRRTVVRATALPEAFRIVRVRLVLAAVEVGGRSGPRLPSAFPPPALPGRIRRSRRRRGSRRTRRSHDRGAAWKSHNRLERSIGQLGRRRSVRVDYGVLLRAISDGPGGRSGARTPIGAGGRRRRGRRLGRIDRCSGHSRGTRRGRLRSSGGGGPGLGFRCRGSHLRRGLIQPSSRRRLPLGAWAEEKTNGFVIRLTHGADHNALNSPITETVDETSASSVQRQSRR
jgi:hypothetical protein